MGNTTEAAVLGLLRNALTVAENERAKHDIEHAIELLEAREDEADRSVVTGEA